MQLKTDLLRPKSNFPQFRHKCTVYAQKKHLKRADFHQQSAVENTTPDKLTPEATIVVLAPIQHPGNVSPPPLNATAFFAATRQQNTFAQIPVD